MLLSRSQFRVWKRWLPLALLLVVLAQLAAASHDHPDSQHSLADCSLCLQQHVQLDGHNGSALPPLPTTDTVTTPTSLPATPASRPRLAAAIRGPPASLC